MHSDVCSILEVSLEGSKYFVTLIEDFSKYCWVYTLNEKSDVFEFFKTWLAMVQRQFEVELQTLICDNGGEYVSREIESLFTASGIISRPTVQHNPHQNAVAERLNTTVCGLIRSMLVHCKLSKTFWAEALSVAEHVRNIATSRGIPPTTTPYEILFGHKPELSHLRVFGRLRWHTNRENLKKLHNHATKAIMIGYSRGSRR